MKFIMLQHNPGMQSGGIRVLIGLLQPLKRLLDKRKGPLVDRAILWLSDRQKGAVLIAMHIGGWPSL